MRHFPREVSFFIHASEETDYLRPLSPVSAPRLAPTRLGLFKLRFLANRDRHPARLRNEDSQRVIPRRPQARHLGVPSDVQQSQRGGIRDRPRRRHRIRRHRGHPRTRRRDGGSLRARRPPPRPNQRTQKQAGIAPDKLNIHQGPRKNPPTPKAAATAESKTQPPNRTNPRPFHDPLHVLRVSVRQTETPQ
jgi:hypothetical protein